MVAPDKGLLPVSPVGPASVLVGVEALHVAVAAVWYLYVISVEAPLGFTVELRIAVVVVTELAAEVVTVGGVEHVFVEEYALSLQSDPPKELATVM